MGLFFQWTLKSKDKILYCKEYTKYPGEFWVLVHWLLLKSNYATLVKEIS